MPLRRSWRRQNPDRESFNNIWITLQEYWRIIVPKISVEIPQHIIDDVNRHVGDDGKFVTFSDAVRTALRKMLDQLDEIDRRQGRLKEVGEE